MESEIKVLNKKCTDCKHYDKDQGCNLSGFSTLPFESCAQWREDE